MSPTDVWGVTSHPEYALLQFQELDCVSLFILSSWASGFCQIYAAAAAFFYGISFFIFSAYTPQMISEKSLYKWLRLSAHRRSLSLTALLGAIDKWYQMCFCNWFCSWSILGKKSSSKRLAQMLNFFFFKATTNNTHYPNILFYFTWTPFCY